MDIQLIDRLRRVRESFASHSRPLLCFGEISWDRLVPCQRLPQAEEACHPLFEQAFVHEGPGGCALNSAFALRVLGAEVKLSGNLLGFDSSGERIHRSLFELGIEDGIVSRAEIATPICYCLVDEKTGERDFALQHDDIQKTDAAVVPPLVAEICAQRYSHIFVQPYVRDLSRSLLQGVQETPVWILTQDLPPESEFIELCNAIQISLEGGQDLSLDVVSTVAQPYFRGRMQEVFVTAGAQGVGYLRKNAEPLLFPAFLAETIVDTTGCGDAFRAGLMLGLSRGQSIETSIEWGQLVGAYKAGINGSCLTELR